MMLFEGTDFWTVGVIVGLTLVTVVTRSFFFISSEEWTLPEWAQRGLQFAPIAAMAAVVFPEILMQQGHFCKLGWMQDGWAPWWAVPCILETQCAVDHHGGHVSVSALHLALGW